MVDQALFSNLGPAQLAVTTFCNFTPNTFGTRLPKRRFLVRIEIGVTDDPEVLIHKANIEMDAWPQCRHPNASLADVTKDIFVVAQKAMESASNDVRNLISRRLFSEREVRFHLLSKLHEQSIVESSLSRKMKLLNGARKMLSAFTQLTYPETYRSSRLVKTWLRGSDAVRFPDGDLFGKVLECFRAGLHQRNARIQRSSTSHCNCSKRKFRTCY